MIKHLLCLCLCVLLFGQVQAQNTYHQIARDTIIRIPGFLGSTYLLDGKRMNLSVMEWFMSDYPQAYDQIRLAVLTDQVSIVSYTIGGLFCFSGLLIQPEDMQTGGKLLRIGLGGIGGGVAFQLLSNRFQKKAVEKYNEEVYTLYKMQAIGITVGVNSNGVGIRLGF